MFLQSICSKDHSERKSKTESNSQFQFSNLKVRGVWTQVIKFNIIYRYSRRFLSSEKLLTFKNNIDLEGIFYITLFHFLQLYLML